MQAFVFPGQGAQFKGMGKALWGRFPEVERQADGVLGYSISDLCLSDPGKQLGKTQFTQPALYVVNALAFLAAREEGAAVPAFAAGHSLGEYNALFAAGAFDFETGLRLVQKRGELMSRAARGAMAAVIGMPPSDVADLCERHGLSQVHVANINSPSQVVVSGDEAEIGLAQAHFEGKPGVRYVRLNVSGAFHSPLMKQAAEEFEALCARMTLRDPALPVVSNVTGRPYPAGQVMDLLVRQITSAVQWSDSVRYMLARGATDFVEIGPGDILTKLISQIRKDAPPLVLEPAAVVEAVAPPVAAPPAAAVPAPVSTPPASAPVAQGTAGADGAAQVRVPSPQVDAAPVAAAALPSTGPHPEPAKPPAGRRPEQPWDIAASSLGSATFKKDYKLKYAYYAGSMYKGIASKELVVRMGKAGFMGFLGTGGMSPGEIDADIGHIQAQLGESCSYGCNLLHSPALPQIEEETVDVLLRRGIKIVEASAYIQVSPALVRYKLRGLARGPAGAVVRHHRVIAKVSHTEVALAFLSPAPERIVRALLEKGAITQEQAELAAAIPLADDLCVEADSGGHTDQGVAYALFPAIARLRDDVLAQRCYAQDIRVGAAGGLGTPQAALAAFMLGADFIVTGSINQCTVEAGTSDAVKDILQDIGVNDTDYAPAGDMFEIGAKVQVVKKGMFFPTRANKLYDIYRNCESLEAIDEKLRKQVEEKYFKRSFAQVWEETRAHYLRKSPAEVERAESSPKHKMALVFRWYFVHSTRIALRGDLAQKVDFQIHCGPALGAFNQWVKGTALENWRARHVDAVAMALMDGTSALMAQALQRYARAPAAQAEEALLPERV